MSDAAQAPPLRTEILAGITTFLTMAYIVVVNPAILSTEGTGMPFAGVLTATVLVSAGCTLLMGLYAKLPYGVAPGMGLNAFFTYGIVLGMGVDWRVALGLVFWAGVLFLLVSVTPIRVAIAEAVPRPLRAGAAGGIGLFLTFIGLKNAGIVAAHPATLVTLGELGPHTLVFAAGLLVAVVLLRRKLPFAFLASIAVCTAYGAMLGDVHEPESLVAMPDFTSVLFQLDPIGALSLSLAPAMISILFTDLFDSLSTFVGVAHAAGLVDDEGRPLRLQQGLIVDAIATLGAGLVGTSSGTAYIESAAGIEIGGRTGRTAIVCGLCFLPFLFLGPLVQLVPVYATAPVLVLVGALMFRASVTSLAGAIDTLEDVMPVFLTVVLIPLTFSITQGMTWGFVAHVVLYALVGRGRELKPMMIVIGCLSAGLLLLEAWV